MNINNTFKFDMRKYTAHSVMEHGEKKKVIYDRISVKPKIENYCAYQERSQQEVRDRLYNWGLHQKDVEELISDLILANFLNEERFALQYALGKFRIKSWGRMKIKHGLKLKRVSEYCIKKALNAIDQDEYISALQKLIEKKNSEIKEKNPFKKKYKLNTYLMGRGFESELIRDLLEKF